jgi:hypothetical protein
MRPPVLQIAALLALVVLAGCSKAGTPVVRVSPTPSQLAQAASPSPSPLPSPSPSPLPSPSPEQTIPTPSPLPEQSAPAPPPSPSPTWLGPRPRSNASWEFDASSGQFVLFGGQYTTGVYHEFPQALGDTWIWDGAHWTQPALASAVPLARSSAATAYDPVHNDVVLHGGVSQPDGWVNDTWLWDGTRWLLQSPQQTPPNVAFQPMAWDGQLKVVVCIVAAINSMTNPDQILPMAWNGTNWSQLPNPTVPTGFASAPTSIAYDTARNFILFFGHVNGTPTTWTYDGTTWRKAASTSGSASPTFSMATDDRKSDVILFGEQGDTWIWDGSQWTAQNPAHSPSARSGASMTYDSVHGLVVLFGGAAGTGENLKELNDVWTWNGTDWTQVSPSS